MKYLTKSIFTLSTLLILGLAANGSQAQTIHISQSPTINAFINILTNNPTKLADSLKHIENNWDINLTPMILETIYLSDNGTARIQLMKILEEKTNQSFNFNIDQWYIWLWAQDYKPHPHYGEFKSILYSAIDPKFAKYFNNERKTNIRLDEVRWGGVVQDGIPPLRYPEMIHAKEANYLDDDNIVFGIEVNGDARAYPKRILAWHEMFVDDVGGKSVTGVYCTLCGTVILYDNVLNNTTYTLGTSGFLYRSNKLMYDTKTQSLWNTLLGEPVIGPLADQNILLKRLSVVTTTWKEWKSRHPETQVLSLNTGHRRNYDEGAAYRQYFATDELMFVVPKTDSRLKNKSEILGLIFSQTPDKPVAISSEYLRKNPIYQNNIEDIHYVVFTDKSGAHRVYESQKITFKHWNQNNTIIDHTDRRWILTENRLSADDGKTLDRLPSHNAFWFGWYSAYGHTKLIQ